MLVLGATALLLAGIDWFAAAVLGLAVAAKLYPLVVLPLCESARGVASLVTRFIPVEGSTSA
jgi:hypothetical protein